MPFTLAAWDESVDSATLQALTPVPDAHLRISGDNLLVPRQAPRLAGCYGLGVSITRARIVAPSLQDFVNPEIEPLDLLAEPSSLPPLHSWFRRPYELVPTEFLSIESSEGGAGATRMLALAWFSDGPIAPIEGDILTVRATNTSTLVADAWTNGALTFTSTLPGGRFQCVGARAESAGLIAFRFNPIGSGGAFRPGAIGFDAASDIEPGIFRHGELGVWFEFDNDTPPTVDFLSVSADTSQVVWMDLIYLGPGA